MTPEEQLARIAGGRVVRSAVGYGTFLDIEVALDGRDPARVHLWVYLAAWALSRGEEELLASDLPDADFDAHASRAAALLGRTVEGVEFRKDAEVHILFSGDYRLELWPNRDLWGDDAVLVKIFVDGSHRAYFVTPPLPAGSLEAGPESAPS